MFISGTTMQLGRTGNKDGHTPHMQTHLSGWLEMQMFILPVY